MKRIVFLNPSSEIGGAERSLLNLMNSIRRAEPDAELHLLVVNDGPLAGEAAKAGVTVHVVPMPPRMLELGDSVFKGRSRAGALFALAWRAILMVPSQMDYVRQLRATIATINPTIIHSNGFKTHILSWLIRWEQAPVVWHLRDFLATRPIVPPLIRLASRRVAAVIAISQAVGADARALLPRTPVHVVYNGVDVETFTPAPYAGPPLEAMAGLPPAPPDVVRVGIIAAYARWKGQDLFLRAAAQYLKNRPAANVRFFIIGGPIYTTRGSQFSPEELRTLAEQLGIAASVGFIGFQKSTAPIYRALDVVVHASTAPEPFGLTIAEGMACGRAVIVSQAGGAAELFTPGEDAMGFVPGDTNDLCRVMQTLIEDSTLRQRIAARARQTVLERFNRNRVGPEVLRVFDTVLAKFSAPPGPKIAPLPAGTVPAGETLADRGSDVRIVFMNPAGVLGGGERNLLDIMIVVKQMLPLAQLHLLCFAEGPFCQAVRQAGIPVLVLPLPKEVARIGDSAMKGAGFLALSRVLLTSFFSSFNSVLRYAQLLQTTLQELRPTIIHTNGIKCHVLSSLADYAPAPTLWQVQDFVGSRPVVNRALRWAGKSAAGAIGITQAVGDDIRALLPKMPVAIIYSAIDTDYFSPSSTYPYDLDALSGLPPAPPQTLRVALVATYARWKGQDVFLKAAARVFKEYPDMAARFFIVGGPIYQTQGSQFTLEELQGMARDLHIEPHVGFVPFQQDIAQVYRSLDIFVHASKQPEPFGRTIVEAMACGKPVVVAKAGGAAELFTHGVDAMGAPPGDPEALAQVLITLLRDADLRATLSRNARHSATTKFARARLAPETVRVYEETLRARAAAGRRKTRG